MESHVAAVLLESDTLESADTRCGPSNRLKLFSRASQYSVVMGEYSMEALEPLYLGLITNLAKQLTLPDGSRAGIELGNPEWTAQEDGILKAKVAVLIPVTVTGGIYRQIPTTSVAEVNIEIKQED